METILKLWKGEISETELYDPAVKEKIEKGVKDEKVIKEADRFYDSLSAEQKRLLASYWLVESSGWSAEVDLAFVSGFRTGALLMMDILKEN